MRHFTALVRAAPAASAALIALAAVLANADTALAQEFAPAPPPPDYTVTRVKGMYVTPPDDVTLLTLGDDTSTRVVLPFEFPYFGTVQDDIWVHANGFVQFGVNRGSQRAVFSRLTPITGDEEGLCGPYWTDTDPSKTGHVMHWTEGKPPERTFFVAWEGVASKSLGGNVSFELQLSEGSGDIVFAYKPIEKGDDWRPFGGFIGQFVWITMDAPHPKDKRILEPDPFFAVSHPGTDYLMEPDVRTYTGKVTYDEIVSDATGLGKSVRDDVPPTGLRAAVMWLNGVEAVSAPIAEDGTFSLTTHGIDATQTGSVELVLQTEEASVFQTGPQPVATVRLDGKVSFKGDKDIGSIAIDAKSDPSGIARAGILSVLTMQSAHDWVTGRLEVEIPPIVVVMDSESADATAYSPADDEFDAALRIAGPSAANPDFADPDVMVRAYGRHVLATIAVGPTTDQDDRFDEKTDRENAFALAFGHYLASAVSQSATFIDGLTADSADVLDLEAPTITAPAGSDVAGRVAASLYDLLDAANESHDEIDGTATPGRVAEVTESFDAPITAESFLERWNELGFGGPELARILIHHEALLDDDDESNDTLETRVELGPIGVRTSGRVLNMFNDDWYGIDLPEDVLELEVAVLYDRDATLTDVNVELRDAAGNLLAASDGGGASEGVRFALDALEAGNYRLLVRHAGGSRIEDYAVQAQEPFVLAAPELRDWTVGRAFDQPLFPRGGIGPYTVSAQPAQSLPPGLTFLDDPARVGGVPFEAGSFTFALRVADAAVPQNEQVVLQRMTINERLAVRLGPFVGIPLGRTPDIAAGRSGGTSPLTATITEGALPPGVTLDATDLRLGGTAEEAGSFDFRLSVEDAAGSSAAAAARGVVAVPMERRATPATLAAGDRSTGYFFDAVAGTRVTFSTRTARRRPRRRLASPVVLGPQGAEVDGGRRRAGRGVASAVRVVLPSTGRHYFITGSETGDETTLVGRVRLVPPRRFAGKLDAFGGGEQHEVAFGALAGARLLVRAVGERGSGLAASIEALIDPEGNVVDVDDLVRTTRRGVLVLATRLQTAGTWKVVFGSNVGARGDLSYVLKLKQPRRGTFSVD